jgi:hypothetical protein
MVKKELDILGREPLNDEITCGFRDSRPVWAIRRKAWVEEAGVIQYKALNLFSMLLR